MNAKTRWLALLLAVCLLTLCGCGRNAVNKEESTAAVQQTAEPVQATEEPAEESSSPEEAEAGAEPAEETSVPAEDPAEKTEGAEKPVEPEVGVEAESVTVPEEQPEAGAKPEPSTEPEPSAEPEASEAPVEAQSAEDADQAEPPVTEEKTEESCAAERPEEESEAAEAAETAAESAPAEEEPESGSEPEETEPEAAEPEIQRTIEITVPAEYADVRYRIGEVTWNPDDSATYRLTEEEHARLLAEVQSDIQQELNEMCASPYFLDFFSIKANEDCSAFTVVCLSIETTMAEQESIQELYEYGKKFAAYEGKEPGNIHIDYMTKIGNTFVTRDSERDERPVSAR